VVADFEQQGRKGHAGRNRSVVWMLAVTLIGIGPNGPFGLNLPSGGDP
jgi:hypothetical protein